ncbi:MAG: pilus assembly protein PilP [Gammaproteobacteria bacterium]|nr:pilus assembly protein PilP [Gammaproteobacteria bacterium]
MKARAIKKYRHIIALPIITLLATSCSKDINDLYDFIETTKASSVGSVAPIPQFEPYQSFTYTAENLRDPFVANIAMSDDQSITKDSLHPESNRPKQYLESFPLDSLSMVGTLEQENNAWGLIKDPKNVVHRVKLGDYIGKNEGRIDKITEVKIYLVEIIPDGIGNYIERDASIAIGNE